MPEQKGTKELKELLDLILGMVDVGVDASKDGKVDVADLGLVLKLVPLIQPAIDHIGDIPGELAHLQAVDAEDLVVHVMTKLAIDDGKARAIIEKSFKLAIAAFELVQAIRA